MMDNTWRTTPINLSEWLPRYINNRYGAVNNRMVNAWQILKATVYNGQLIRDGAEAILTGRPTFDSTTVWTRTRLNYPPGQMLPAWDIFVQQADSLGGSDGFRYDLVDITRQVLANYALPLQQKWIAAFRAKDNAAFNLYSHQFLTLAADMDTLLATRKDFLLGPWLASARSWGSTSSEKALYEQNARDIITLWGGANSPLHEYANRQWSGMMNDFYGARWAQFFAMLTKALQQNTQPDLAAFEKQVQQWEWQWVNSSRAYPVKPVGNSVIVAEKIYNKYRSLIGNAYQ